MISSDIVNLEDLGIGGRIILNMIFKTWVGGMDWIDMAHDRDMWQVLANAVMNLHVPQNVGSFLTG
jgi:hypothetical protein